MDASPPDGLRERAPHPDDLEAVLDLIDACDIEDIGMPDYSLADLESDWAHVRFELADDARLLVDAAGRPRAYIAVRQHEPGRRFWGDLYVHPDARDGEAHRWGAAFAESRAAALAESADASVFLYAEDGSDLAALLADRGYDDVRRMYRMEREFDIAPTSDGDLPAPRDLPDGIEIRTFDRADARRVHAAVEEAFTDEWGFVEQPFEEWAARKLDHADFDPSTWWVAWDGAEVAGVVLASVAEGLQGAWISTVGVRRPWRGKGLALALLRTAFRALAARGVASVALGVDSENPTGATRLYERAGMHVATCWVRYERPAGPAPPVSGDRSVRQ